MRTPDTGRRALLAAAAAFAAGPALAAEPVQLLNVSYDPTRELYRAVNAAFTAAWRASSGQDLGIRMSHGGSGAQARAVIEGLEADVVTLALAWDIEAISARGLIAPGWQSRLPHNACPYTSVIVMLTRPGNPKGVRDWADLARPGTSVIAANPRTSGGARWIYLSAWAWATRHGQNPESFVASVYRNVPVLDTGSRGSTTTFVQRGLGDVLLAWENEAHLALQEAGAGAFEIVYPSLSMLAEPPVAVVDQVVDRRHTRDVAEAYLRWLYTAPAQALIAKHFYRAWLPSPNPLPVIDTVTVDDVFGGWKAAHAAHFAQGGSFDRIISAR